MSTYSTSRRVNGPGHPLNGRLRGYYWGPIPWVLWAAIYGPTNLDTTRFPAVARDWGTKYPVPDMAPPLLAEGEGPPTQNELDLGAIYTSQPSLTYPRMFQCPWDDRILSPVSLV
jgi:hypothetical protein